MLALVTTPGEAGTTEVAEVADPDPRPGEVLVRTLEVGVCGTDREISEGLFGAAPDGEDRLILGHESLGVVERDGHGFSRGDLVTAVVRRSCEHCRACAEGAPDACLTGDYVERGITRLHGYAAELVAEAPDQLVAVPRDLGRLGVLAEPSSICARALRHAHAVAGRQPWSANRALVVGPGAIGLLSAVFLRLDGYEVVVSGRRPREDNPKADLVEACGATYVQGTEDLGAFDVVVEAAGHSQVMLDTLRHLGRNGVAVLLGLDGEERTVELDGRVLGVDVILENRALIGSVNANRVDWEDAVRRLDETRRSWPGLLDEVVGLRVAPDRFAEAFDFGGVKAALDFS